MNFLVDAQLPRRMTAWLTSRLATRDDAAQIQAIYAPYCRTPISFEAESPSAEEMRERLQRYSNNIRGWFAKTAATSSATPRDPSPMPFVFAG